MFERSSEIEEVEVLIPVYEAVVLIEEIELKLLILEIDMDRPPKRYL